jgi:hypothetical protein
MTPILFPACTCGLSGNTGKTKLAHVLIEQLYLYGNAPASSGKPMPCEGEISRGIILEDWCYDSSCTEESAEDIEKWR